MNPELIGGSPVSEEMVDAQELEEAWECHINHPRTQMAILTVFILQQMDEIDRLKAPAMIRFVLGRPSLDESILRGVLQRLDVPKNLALSGCGIGPFSAMRKAITRLDELYHQIYPDDQLDDIDSRDIRLMPRPKIPTINGIGSSYDWRNIRARLRIQMSLDPHEERVLKDLLTIYKDLKYGREVPEKAAYLYKERLCMSDIDDSVFKCWLEAFGVSSDQIECRQSAIHPQFSNPSSGLTKATETSFSHSAIDEEIRGKLETILTEVRQGDLDVDDARLQFRIVFGDSFANVDNATLAESLERYNFPVDMFFSKADLSTESAMVVSSSSAEYSLLSSSNTTGPCITTYPEGSQFNPITLDTVDLPSEETRRVQEQIDSDLMLAQELQDQLDAEDESIHSPYQADNSTLKAEEAKGCSGSFRSGRSFNPLNWNSWNKLPNRKGKSKKHKAESQKPSSPKHLWGIPMSPEDSKEMGFKAGLRGRFLVPAFGMQPPGKLGTLSMKSRKRVPSDSPESKLEPQSPQSPTPGHRPKKNKTVAFSDDIQDDKAKALQRYDGAEENSDVRMLRGGKNCFGRDIFCSEEGSHDLDTIEVLPEILPTLSERSEIPSLRMPEARMIPRTPSRMDRHFDGLYGSYHAKDLVQDNKRSRKGGPSQHRPKTSNEAVNAGDFVHRFVEELPLPEQDYANHRSDVNSYFQSPNVANTSLAVVNSLNKLFNKYRESPDESPDTIGVEGAMRYLNDLGVNLDEVTVLAISEALQAPTMGEFNREGFVDGWRSLDADTMIKQQEAVSRFRTNLPADRELFKRVYKYTFFLARLPGQKAVALDAAIEYWRLLFEAPSVSWNTDSTPWLDWFIEFLQSKWKKTVNRDMWDMTFAFFQRSTEDETMSWWDENGAWPGVLDDFVLYVKERRGRDGQMDLE